MSSYVRTLWRPVSSLGLVLLVGMISMLTGCDSHHTVIPVGTGQVAGYVYYTTGGSSPANALQGATVSIQGLKDQTSTGSDGSYSISSVPSGLQTLDITCNGYRSASQVVNVTSTGISAAPNVTLTTAQYKWAVLVYLDADNNLDPYGVLNVDQMESVPASSQVVTAVQMSRMAAYATGAGSWTGCRRFTIQHVANDTSMASSDSSYDDMGTVDMSNPATLQSFVQWGTSTFTAEHYLLVLWDHGDGWYPRAVTIAPPTRAILYDFAKNTTMQVTDIPDAIRQNPPLDIVACDACEMQMAEDGYEWKDVCNYMVGSEEDVPGAGYPYNLWLGDLVSQPTMTPSSFASDIAQETYNAYYASTPDITHSAVDESQMPQLAAAVATFSQALQGDASAEAGILATARTNADSYSDYDYKDLYDYASRVMNTTAKANVKTAAQGVITALNAAILVSYAGSAHANSHGLSIYIPPQTTYQQYASAYSLLTFCADAKWGAWLGAQAQ